ncbi:uncharacterized protein RAG0_10204 [Rhynchosporium agropyri]|uniref:Uncharacterized protein n=1 Tax=Rhynchosporium agropyri TaxID=914238 RepID=A0A1E1KYX8_9HELO|nr:uncharacterized protein RAG0_10204 [Rhynchosporium agropyri]
MMFLQPLVYGLLALVLLLTLVRAEYDISKELTPLGPLQVRIDYNLVMEGGPAHKNRIIRTIVYSSHLKFERDVNAFSDGQLVQMAFDAYNEMVEEVKHYGFSGYGKPSVMTVAAIGQEIFLASSQKGRGAFITRYPKSQASKSLAICQITFNNGLQAHQLTSGHANESKCGEIMAAHSFFRNNPSYETIRGLGGRIVSVDELGGSSPLAIKEPCGTGIPNAWGCNLFVQDQGLTVIPRGTTPVPYQLNAVAGVATINQIPLCS